MRKSNRAFVIVIICIAVVSVAVLTISHGGRTRQRAMKLQTLNRVATVSFPVTTNALATRQNQTP